MDTLNRELTRLRAENARLAAIVAKLPITKDRTPVVFGDVVYHPNSMNGLLRVCRHDDGERERWWAKDPYSASVPLEECYSTRAAAEAAAGKGG